MSTQHRPAQPGHNRTHSHGDPTAPHASGNESAGPLPIVVGVTGHRDLRQQDLPALEAIVKRLLRELQVTHPHTPLLVLSPLAEGSDRLVARVALDVGVRLIVPMPLPQDLYEQDFSSDESRAEFRQLLSRAETSYVLPLDGRQHRRRNRAARRPAEPPVRAGRSADRETEPGVPRAVGRTRRAPGMTTRSEAPEKWSGSASKEFRRAMRRRSIPLSLSSSGPVHHIVTPREGQPVPDKALTEHLVAAQSPDRRVVRRTPRMDGPVQRRRTRIQRVDGGAAARRARRSCCRSRKSALAGAVLALPHSARITLERYAVADTLALHFAGLTRVGHAQDVPLGVRLGAVLQPVPLAAARAPSRAPVARRSGCSRCRGCCCSSSARRLSPATGSGQDVEEEDYQNKHQDYRALAEALRIQFFWHVAGVPAKVVDHYLRKQRGALEWIRNALRAWDAESLAVRITRGGRAGHRSALAYVGQHWVSEQRNYYASKARREQATLEAEERKIEWLVRISVVLALLLAVVLTVPLLVPIHELEAIKHLVEDPWIHGIVMVVIVTLAVTAGLRHGYNQQMARSEHAKQFGRMAELFDAAEKHLSGQLKARRHGPRVGPAQGARPGSARGKRRLGASAPRASARSAALGLSAGPGESCASFVARGNQRAGPAPASPRRPSRSARLRPTRCSA